MMGWKLLRLRPNPRSAHALQILDQHMPMTNLSTTTVPAWAQQIERMVRWCLRHWLLFANGLVLLYGGLPWLSPLAYASGHPVLGQLLFRLYTPLCHQIPERSFFLLGYQVAFCHREAAMYT